MKNFSDFPTDFKPLPASLKIPLGGVARSAGVGLFRVQERP